MDVISSKCHKEVKCIVQGITTPEKTVDEPENRPS